MNLNGTKLSILLSVIGLLGILSISPAHAVPIYATSIANSTDSNFPATNVLGAPDLLVSNFFQDSDGNPGFVDVSFDSALGDFDGNDIFIHAKDWVPGENEIFEVFASAEGSTGSFISLGESGAPTGAASPTVSVVGFDLSLSGLSTAKFIRVMNLRTGSQLAGVGVDIDAIQATAIPVPATLLLFGLGSLGIVYGRRRF